MNIIDFIILALAIGIDSFSSIHKSVRNHPIPLPRGLAIATLMAAIFIGFTSVGILISNALRFNYTQIDKVVCIAFILLVALKRTIESRKQINGNAFNLSQYTQSIVFSIAKGINILLLGLGIGFVENISCFWKISIPIFVLVLIFSMWGTMLGRKQIEMNYRRWGILSTLCLIIIAIKVAISL